MTKNQVIEKWNSLSMGERDSWIAKTFNVECDNCGKIGNCYCNEADIGIGVPYFSNGFEAMGTLTGILAADGWDSVNISISSLESYGVGGSKGICRATVSCGYGPCDRHCNLEHDAHGAFNVEAEFAPEALALAALIAKLGAK